MIANLSGIIVDVALIGGLILFCMSFIKKFSPHNTKLLVAGVVLIALGLFFIDTSALYEAFQSGYNAAGSSSSN